MNASKGELRFAENDIRQSPGRMNGHTAGNHIRHVNEFKPTLRQGFGRTRMPWCRKPTKHREVFFQQRDTKRQQALWHAVHKKEALDLHLNWSVSKGQLGIAGLERCAPSRQTSPSYNFCQRMNAGGVRIRFVPTLVSCQ